MSLLIKISLITMIVLPMISNPLHCCMFLILVILTYKEMNEAIDFYLKKLE